MSQEVPELRTSFGMFTKQFSAMKVVKVNPVGFLGKANMKNLILKMRQST